MGVTSIVPANFVLPAPIATSRFRLALLGPEHNESDYAAWTASMGFIRGLPGWARSTWPTPMTLEENLNDCRSHLSRSHAGSDFAYTVLRPDRAEVIGCVYFKPPTPAREDAVGIHSWVTAEHRHLDKPIYDAVTVWLAQKWPWSIVNYAPR